MFSHRLNRRRFLATTSAALVVPAVHSFAKERASELYVGLAADAQYAEAEPKGKRHYREGDNRLADAVAEFNRENVDCCFHLGDLIDRDFASFDNCVNAIKELKKPCYQVLGNHDFDVAEELKLQVPERIALADRYYSRRMDKFRFVMLDGTDVSTFAYPKSDPRFKASSQTLEELRKLDTLSAQTWNGGIGAKQLEWLHSELAAATEADERVILMCHYPILPAANHNLWNDRELLQVIDKHPCVMAWFNGHNHAGDYVERNGVHYVTLHGMVEHETTNSFGFATMTEQGISIKGSGRLPSRELKFRAMVEAAG